MLTSGIPKLSFRLSVIISPHLAHENGFPVRHNRIHEDMTLRLGAYLHQAHLDLACDR